MVKGLLMLVGFFLLMFVLASICVVVINKIFQTGTRESLVCITVMQTVLLFGVPAMLTAVWLRHKDWLSFLALDRGIGLLAFESGVILLLLSIPALNQLIYYNSEMVLPWPDLQATFKSWEESAVKTTDILLNTDSVGGLISGIITVGILTGLCEEMFFRGILQRLFTFSGVNVHLSVWVTAIIFSAAHFQFYGFIPRLVLGAFLGYFLVWSGSLWLPVICHALNNSLVVIFKWMQHRGIMNENIDMMGISEGFPWIAVLSAILVVSILAIGHKQLFARR